jgi:hypothetical protein
MFLPTVTIAIVAVIVFAAAVVRFIHADSGVSQKRQIGFLSPILGRTVLSMIDLSRFFVSFAPSQII